MTEPRILAEIDGRSGYAGLVAMFRARIAELEVAMEEVDARAGLPLRYTSKLLGKNQSKKIGSIGLGPLLGALGVKLLAVVDETAPINLPKRGPQGPHAHGDAHARKRRVNRISWAKAIILSSAIQRSNAARFAASCRWKEHNRLKARRLRRKVRDKLMGL